MRTYYKYSEFLRDKYGVKTYKLPVSIATTCPNRDGTLAVGGCIYCSQDGAGFETSHCNDVDKQMRSNKAYIAKRYRAKKFIAYFQDFSATYLASERLLNYMAEALIDHSIVEISLSTRPDCLAQPLLEDLLEFADRHAVNVTIELGLQSVNDATLQWLGRGHDLACFIDCAQRVKQAGLELAVHLIANLPHDEIASMARAAQLCNALAVDSVKLHSLYVLRNTVLAEQYLNHQFEICTIEQYFERVACFLSRLNPEIAIQRLFGRAPKSETLFCNWGRSWRYLHDELMLYLNQIGCSQGIAYRAFDRSLHE